ncbi:MAG: hypothetical protein IKR71_07670 [Bacteroidales bacterium]|nr:hypothetical protein [Bacteroidales bacterium]
MKKILFFLPLLFLCLACHKEPMPESESLPLPEQKEFDIRDYMWKAEYYMSETDTIYPFKGLQEPFHREYAYQLFFRMNIYFGLHTSNNYAMGEYGDYTKGYEGAFDVLSYGETSELGGPYTPFDKALISDFETITHYEVYGGDGDSLMLFGDGCQFLFLRMKHNKIMAVHRRK